MYSEARGEFLSETVLQAESSGLCAIQERTKEITKHIEAEIFGLGEKLSCGTAHVAELYVKDPAEMLRADLAFMEYSLKMAGRQTQDNIPSLRDLLGKIYALQTELDKVKVDPLKEELVADETRSEKGTYMVYLRNLDLSEDDIKGKTILDVGAGSRRFAGYCLRNNISDKVYSLEPLVFPVGGSRQPKGKVYLNRVLRPVERAVLDNHTVQAYADQMPFPDQTFDLVLIRAGGITADSKGIERSTDEYNQICRVLKVGGEFRTDAHLVDFSDYDPDNPEAQRMLQYKAQNEAQLEILRQTGKFDITIEPRETDDLPPGKSTFGKLVIKKLKE